ncbi:hypothetical protein T265_09343 [Opisthorchis viverrini]|uniref:Uncharacterized protein n=1 Tax=Opisthorchis viverrini TaxID=6198 RepID=A0A075A5C1_OPIVI|nr:hypothetical protein T265_09343 [Opisthorchis viverrini]KER22609.1 hypothetical protein T265_09343 [Opisthorchis viverrini]
MFNRGRSTFVGGLRDMSAEAVVCSTFGIQPGIVKQTKEKFASDTESSSYNVFNKVARSSRGSSANASLKSEYDFALRGDSGGKYNQSGSVFRRPPLFGRESGIAKGYFSEGSIHNIREINGVAPRLSNTPRTGDLAAHTRGISERKEHNFRGSLLSTQMISTDDSYGNAFNGHNDINLNNGCRVFGTVEDFGAERTDLESSIRFPPVAKSPTKRTLVSTGQDGSLSESPANGTFENLKSDKMARFRPNISNPLSEDLSNKNLFPTHIKQTPFSYIHSNDVANQRELIHQSYTAAPFQFADRPASDATKLTAFRSPRAMSTKMKRLYPISSGTLYAKSEFTSQRPSSEYNPVQIMQHNPAPVNLSPCSPWDKWSGQEKPVAVGAETSDSYSNNSLQSSIQVQTKPQFREQRRTEKCRPLSRHSGSLVSNVFENPTYAVSLSMHNDVLQNIGPPESKTVEDVARKSVNDSQEGSIGALQGHGARRCKSFVMHRSNTISLSKADSYSEGRREKSAHVLETSRFPQTCWWTYPYLSNRHYRYPPQKAVHSDGYNERISRSKADEPKDRVIQQETLEEMKEHLAECKKSHDTRDVVPDKAHLIKDENNSQPPKPLQAPSLRKHSTEKHAFGRGCQKKASLNGVHNENVSQLFAERNYQPSTTFDDQKIISSRAEQENVLQNHDTSVKTTLPMSKTHQGDMKTQSARQSSSLESQSRFFGPPPREWVPGGHSENPTGRPILRSNSQPQTGAFKKDSDLVESTTKRPSREAINGAIPKPPLLEMPDVLNSPKHQKGDLEHCDPSDVNRTMKRRTLSMPSSNRNSSSSISQRPEYTVLTQKLEEQFRTATSWIKPKVTTAPLSKSKPKDLDPEPSNGKPVVEKSENKAEAALTARPSYSWPQSGNAAGKTIQPMQKQLMMELAETLAKRTENVDTLQFSSSPPKTEFTETKQGNIPPHTSPEVAAVSSKVKPDDLFAFPKPFAPMNSTLKHMGATNETVGCRDAPPNVRPGVTTSESPVGMFNSAPFPITNLVPMQNDKQVGNTDQTVGFRDAASNFRPGVTTKEPSVGMFNPVPFPSTNPVPAHNDKIELESGHVETREPVPVFTPPSKAPSMPVFGQISDSDQLTNSKVQHGPINGDAKIPDPISKEQSKPTPRPRVLFPPDDKLTTTHDYEVDSRISSPTQLSNDYRGLVMSNDLRMYKSNIEDTSDTASNCSTTIEPLRRSRKQYPRPRMQFTDPSPDIPELRTASATLGPKPYRIPPHFQRHKTTELSEERSPSLERPNSAPATAHTAVKPNPLANLPKYPWKPYPLNP